MIRMFRVSLKRAFNSISLIIISFVCLSAGIFEGFMYHIEGKRELFSGANVEFACYTHLFMILPIIILVSIQTIREFSSGTVRNKLIVGATKTQFYFAQLLTNCALTLIMSALYFVTYFIIINPLFDLGHYSFTMALLFVFMLTLGYLMITIITTVITMLFGKALLSMVFTVTILLGTTFVALWFASDLVQPKFFYEGTADGDVTGVANPMFVERGTKRDAMSLYIYTSPVCQFYIVQSALSSGVKSEEELPKPYGRWVQPSIRSYYDETDYSRYDGYDEEYDEDDDMFIKYNLRNIYFMPVYSLCASAVIILLGAAAFKRKNIK